MMSNHKKKIKLASSVVFILSIAANISSQASKETASKTSENTSSQAYKSVSKTLENTLSQAYESVSKTLENTSSQAYESVSKTLENTLSQAYESGSKTLENTLSQAYESGSKTLENALSWAEESGSKMAKALLSCLVTVVSKIIDSFLTPIVLFLFVYAFYYNYFVLHDNIVRKATELISKGVGSVLGLAVKLLTIFNSTNEKKDEKEDEKKVPELITVEKLEEELKDIEKKLKSKDLSENVVGEVKNKIDELKSRINATRGGFINGLKYYITTSLIFRSTRHKYNKLESQLNNLEKSLDIIPKISQFNNELKEKFTNLKNGNNLTLSDLLGKEGSLSEGFTSTLSDINNLRNKSQDLPDFAKNLEEEVQGTYHNLVKEIAHKEFSKIVDENNYNLLETFLELFINIEYCHTTWPEDFLRKIKGTGEFYRKEVEIIFFNRELNSLVKKIVPNTVKKDVYNEIEKINSLLKSGNFLSNLFGFEKKVENKSITILDNIYRNYNEIEETYKLLKQTIISYKIDIDSEKKKTIKERKKFFDAICGKKSVIKNAKDAYMKVDDAITKLDTNVETEGKDIFGYIKSIKSKIKNVLVKLENELKNLETNGNSKELNRVLEKKISNEKLKYLKISKNLDILYKKIESWKKSVESKKGYEQIANNTGKDIKVLAAEICNSEEIKKLIDKNGDKYKGNLLSIFSKEKSKMLTEVNDMLSSVKKEIDDKKSKLNVCITNVKQFLENPNLGDSKTKCDELKQILKEINDFAKEKTNKELLFYPENTGIEKVNNLANLLEIYSKTNEIVNQKNDGIDKLFKDLSIYIEKFKSINSENYYSIYCKYCVDQIKIIIDEHLKNNKEINYAISLTNLEKIIELLPNEESKNVLEKAINTLKTNWNSRLNGYLKDCDGKITMSDDIKNIVNKDVCSILNKTIEYINEADAATRLEKKDNTTAEYLIKLFNKINEADKNLKILNTDYKIEISLLNEKIEAINSYIQNCLKGIDDKSIFEKFFNDFAYSLKNDNNKEAERLFSNMETFFSKFYKNSGIYNFFSNNKDLRKDIENILNAKEDKQIDENFGDKYENMPESIKKTIADYFQKETDNLFKEYLKAEDGFFFDDDDSSTGREILKSIHSNIRKFKAICGTDFSNDLDACIARVFNYLLKPKGKFSDICRELIEKALEYNSKKLEMLENVIIKLLCDFISFKDEAPNSGDVVLSYKDEAPNSGDVVLSYVKKLDLKGLENNLLGDNFTKLSNTIESIKKDNDTFSKKASKMASVVLAQMSCFFKNNYY